MYRLIVGYSVIVTALVFCSCRNSNQNGCVPVEHAGMVQGHYPPVLLFDGTGTSPCDVVAIETLLDEQGILYATANSARLNGMSESTLRNYRLLIVPGGNFIDMGNSLTAATVTNLHQAVQKGVSYLGICAGGFLAGHSSYYKSFNLAAGKKFGFYSGERKGLRKAAVTIAIAGGPAQAQYWEDGPEFTGWGSVVGKYPDGAPAIVQGRSGSGWMILAGTHPEAPEYWRGMTFITPYSSDNAYAIALIRAAMGRIPLAHF